MSVTAIGLMSGTSLDGIDCAIIKTDGENHIERIFFETFPYSDEQRDTIRKAFGKSDEDDPDVQLADDIITDAHIDILQPLLIEHSADLIGFHGQTIFHDPDNKFSLQIGKAERLARRLGITTVAQQRQEDLAKGGQGAPLAPIYHHALLRNIGAELPAIWLNIGGVSNITYVTERPEDMIAFDCGPGNALIDDRVSELFNMPFDKAGAIASQGNVSQVALQSLLNDGYFQKGPPKSLDRDHFDIARVKGLDPNDQIATLTAFTVEGIVKAVDICPGTVKTVFVSGGGRHNNEMMNSLRDRLDAEIVNVDDREINGDAVEAELFAYMAVRTVMGLPNSFPGTTGVSKPVVGGEIVESRKL